MGLQPAQLAAIAAAVDDATAPDLAARLHAQFPDLHITVCADDDIIGARPVLELGGFNLYLVDGGSHCLGLTSDPAAASGVVVAWVEAEEG
ncbi:MAG: DUF6129 family protein [Pseudomonadota bacterium]